MSVIDNFYLYKMCFLVYKGRMGIEIEIDTEENELTEADRKKLINCIREDIADSKQVLNSCRARLFQMDKAHESLDSANIEHLDDGKLMNTYFLVQDLLNTGAEIYEYVDKVVSEHKQEQGKRSVQAEIRSEK